MRAPLPPEPLMILPRYRDATSQIPGAGMGISLDEPVARGNLILAPDDAHKVYKWNAIVATVAVYAIGYAQCLWGRA
jgi:hypothetical protein